MAETNLDILLSSMNPQLHDEEFVFVTVSDQTFKSIEVNPLSTFREEEGISLIVEKLFADKASLTYSGLWSLITCKINSSLAAVGFLAAIANALADAGIALNPVSAYFHDHLLVPKDKAEQAMTILRQLSTSKSAVHPES